MATDTPSHIVAVAHPVYFILRIAQLVLAVSLLGLLAYLAWAYDTALSGTTTVYSGAIGVGLFTACLTIIFGVYYLVSTRAMHNLYNKWAVLALEAAAVLFWLISFALIADCVSGIVSAVNYTPSYTYTYCDSDGYCYKRLGKRDVFGAWSGVFYAALALSVVEWLLFVATLVLLSLALHKQRRAAAPATQQEYTPKAMEAGPAPVYEQQPAAPQQTYEQPAVAQPVQHEQQPMH